MLPPLVEKNLRLISTSNSPNTQRKMAAVSQPRPRPPPYTAPPPVQYMSPSQVRAAWEFPVLLFVC